MSEEDIEMFISVTSTDRRVAQWFLNSHHDLNDAVLNYFERGVGSIPPDFNPDAMEEEEEMDESTDSDEFVEESTDSDEPPPTRRSTITTNETQAQETISLQQTTDEEPNTIGIAIKQQKNEIKAGSQLSYILGCTKSGEQLDEVVFTTKPPDPYTRKLQNTETSIFIIWKNGYSLNSEFTPLLENEYISLINDIQVGKLPVGITNNLDIQLVNKSNENYVPFDEGKIFAFH